MLNRFFGQNPQKEIKHDKDAEQEQSTSKSTSEQRFTFLSRTRQLFGRLGNTVQETDTITDRLWDELEESLLGADVGPSTTQWLIERLH
ncbi:MAG TPA: signal recognition particle receptor subunit alpha, partial [Ktedonobacteraceae bacterium]|nr:signal recognition particle receptor subunit alpha [Ktedonobacteraceae bacterium]